MNVYKDTKDYLLYYLGNPITFETFSTFEEYNSFGQNDSDIDFVIQIGRQPDKENSVTLIPTAGLGTDEGRGGTKRSGLQILVNHSDYAKCLDIIEQIDFILDNTRGDNLKVVKPDSKVYGYRLTGSAIDLGEDSNDRTTMSVNYLIYQNK